jgi:hypothetical protein
MMTSWHPSRAVLIVLALSVIGATGCGSSGGSRSGASTATRSVAGGFIAQLNATCRSDVAALSSTAKTVGAEAPAERRFIQELQLLTAPAKLKPSFSQYVSLLEQNLATFEHHDVAASKRLMARIALIVAKLRHDGATSC